MWREMTRGAEILKENNVFDWGFFLRIHHS
jgi:hypothetical protein